MLVSNNVDIRFIFMLQYCGTHLLGLWWWNLLRRLQICTHQIILQQLKDKQHVDLCKHTA